MPSKHKIKSLKTKKAAEQSFTQALFAATIFHLRHMYYIL